MPLPSVPWGNRQNDHLQLITSRVIPSVLPSGLLLSCATRAALCEFTKCPGRLPGLPLLPEMAWTTPSQGLPILQPPFFFNGSCSTALGSFSSAWPLLNVTCSLNVGYLLLFVFTPFSSGAHVLLAFMWQRYGDGYQPRRFAHTAHSNSYFLLKIMWVTINSEFFFFLKSAHVDIRTCVYAGVYTCRDQKRIMNIPSICHSPPWPLWGRDLSLNLGLSFLGWTGSQKATAILSQPLSELGLQTFAEMPGLLRGCWDANSSLCGLRTSTLKHWALSPALHLTMCWSLWHTYHLQSQTRVRTMAWNSTHLTLVTKDGSDYLAGSPICTQAQLAHSTWPLTKVAKPLSQCLWALGCKAHVTEIISSRENAGTQLKHVGCWQVLTA